MENKSAKKILKELCVKHNISFVLMQEMLDYEQSNRHIKTRTHSSKRLRGMIEKSLGVKR